MKHYCDFVIISQTPRAILERCKECGKRLVTGIGNDKRIDNRKYLKEHVRDTAQPGGVTGSIFKRFYGKKRV